MSRHRSRNRRRTLRIQLLETRQLMAADIGIRSSDTISDTQKDSEFRSAYVTTIERAAPVNEEIDLAAEVGVSKDLKLTEIDAPTTADAIGEIGAEEPTRDDGLADLGQERIERDIHSTIADLGGDTLEISTGYQSSLEGANADEPGAHPNTTPGKVTESKKILDAYDKGGLDTSGKSAFQMQHACLSLDGDEYKRKDQTGEAHTFNSGSLLNNNHSSDDNEEATPVAGGGGDGDPDDGEVGDGSGDGDGTGDGNGGSSDTTGTGEDGGETTPPADPPAGDPDYGEGYVDPEDPLLDVWSDMIDAHAQQNFEAMQNAEINPNPMDDPVTTTEGPTTDYLDWIDGGHLVINTDVPDHAAEAVANHDDGHTDPVDH